MKKCNIKPLITTVHGYQEISARVQAHSKHFCVYQEGNIVLKS